MTQARNEIIIRSAQDADRLMSQIRSSAAHIRDWFAVQADPLKMLQAMKFDSIGVHPIDGSQISLVEEVDFTWTYSVAVAAARHLLMLHPEAGGFRLVPGANDSRDVDVISESDGLVRAETFAAAVPRNHRKIKQELHTLAARTDTHRYLFFFSPALAGNMRQPQLERGDVQIWSIDV